MMCRNVAPEALLGEAASEDEEEDRERAAEGLKAKALRRQREMEEKEAAKMAIEPARGAKERLHEGSWLIDG